MAYDRYFPALKEDDLDPLEIKPSRQTRTAKELDKKKRERKESRYDYDDWVKALPRECFFIYFSHPRKEIQ